jgi:hypothetical protein
VTLVAGPTLVDIAADSPVLGIGLTLAVLVTEDALEDVVVSRRHVTGRAGELVAP